MQTSKSQIYHPPPQHLVVYCAGCASTCVFIRLPENSEWICVGDPRTRREGCGKRLHFSA